ncbi:CHAT domain-containing tetratricopeptide repeat protein [Synechococcus sp. BA-132 BA5]|uniref:CHAT domain-containing tetratricopeptide repeat protein n=1 Tax=Synechococcus sp. BA-132 BA5 TaxID=3110252 RepID=UPI002B1F8542|nr:CHAT domain-containing tetratricopeptide repeat protein [Synechococcus sp. BA-132 BA5]MEA5413636.1 CHAT domain-containing tetratricopeptide repeat protein [Synechococcus sp. BA-132 BA5]
MGTDHTQQQRAGGLAKVTAVQLQKHSQHLVIMMKGLVTSAAAALLLAAGKLAEPAWGNYAAEQRLVDTTVQKVEPLFQLQQAINEKELGPEHPITATSLNNLAELYRLQGLYAKAEPLYQRALAISEKVLGPEHPSTAASLNNLALLYRDQGLYAMAVPLSKRVLAINEKALGQEHPTTATSLRNLAGLYHKQGLYAKVEPLYQRALAIDEKVLGPKHPSTATSLNGLAELYRFQGLYAKAEPLYQRALDIYEKELGPKHPNTSTIFNNLAELYRLQGLYAKAEPLYQRALAIHEKVLGPEHPSTAASLNYLAEFYDDQGIYSKAEPLYLRALLINEKALGLEHSTTANSLNNLALLYNKQGLYAKAEPLYLRALLINEKVLGSEHSTIANSLSNLALLYANQGLYVKAEPLLRRGLAMQVILIQREAPYLPISERLSFLQTFSNTYIAAFSYAQRGNSGANLALFSRLNRQGLLQEIEQRQAQIDSLPGPQQAFAGELRTVSQQVASMAHSPEQRQQLESRQEELEKQLYRLLPQLQPRVVEVQQVAAALPAGSALIEFQRYELFDGTKARGQNWGEDCYLALVLKPDGTITPIDLGLAKPIDDLIQSALDASEQKQADALELWAQVGRSVLDPLSAATHGVDTLFISPDGELNRVPFAALPAPGSSQLLSEELQLRLLTTGRELLDLQNTSSVKTSPALVVANPAFDRKPITVQSPRLAISSQQRSGDLGSRRWAPLPGTATEGATIAQLTGGRLLAGEQASAASIQQQQQAPRLLHLATHAYFQPDLPAAERMEDQPLRSNVQEPTALGGENPLLRSGIVLAGANQPDADPADDGYLTALEVARLNWKGTELVVVSACESGKGDIQAGEGVYGLKRAIAVAGARSSLLSLWKVDDRATAAFMESFYSKLKAGVGRADALAATQQEFRQSNNATWRHPYVWAAFQLSGDWGAVRW